MLVISPKIRSIQLSLSLTPLPRPISDAWNVFKPLSEKRCINQQAFVIFLAVANATFDILVFLWPAPVLWSIKLPRHTRITLLLSFCCGVLYVYTFHLPR